MFYALAVDEEFYADKISVFLAIGPVTRISNTKSTLVRELAAGKALLEKTCQKLGIYELFSANWLTTGSMRLLCNTLPKVCETAIYFAADEDMTKVDEARV